MSVKYKFRNTDGIYFITFATVNWVQQKLDYIHNNAVEAGIVYEPHHYVYSSAAQYAGKEQGLLPIKFLL